mmetsp:Transcript_985/g.1348  ORF Transcript_985/g.1348 Transcript_985/m.1348 type:complete len:227 (-) Transcript_985:480-1160(-)
MPISRVSSAQPTLSRQARCTLASGRADSVMVSANRPGATGPNTRESGEKTVHMARADLFMSMETFMTGTGPTIKPMVAVSTSTSTVRSMRACGRTTCSTGTVWRPGRTSLAMRATMLSAASTVSAATSGTMAPCTRATGARTKSVVLASTPGSMVASIRASGWTTTWRAWAFTSGTMAECTRASTKTTKSTVSASIPGPISAATRATGTRASSTDSAPTSCPKTTR